MMRMIMTMNGLLRAALVVLVVAVLSLFSDNRSTPTIAAAFAPPGAGPPRRRGPQNSIRIVLRQGTTILAVAPPSSSSTQQQLRQQSFMTTLLSANSSNQQHPTTSAQHHQDQAAMAFMGDDWMVQNQQQQQQQQHLAKDHVLLKPSISSNPEDPKNPIALSPAAAAEPWKIPSAVMMTMLSLPLLLSFVLIPEAAQAITTNAAPIPNALVAYAHYASLLVCTALLTYERTTVQAGLTVAQEKSLVAADAGYGVTALVVGISGIYRAIEYGKGWEFYSHEPIFWLKLALVGLWFSLSLFPTITLVRRGIPLFQGGTVEPLSEALARRLQQVITAELSALLTIPVTATLMARGVGYSNDFPWPVGAALVTLVTAGSAFVYAKQALTWTEQLPE